MVTYIVDLHDTDIPEGVQFTIGEETKVTDAKGKCIFNNLKPGYYEIRLFKEGVGASVFRHKINDTPDIQVNRYVLSERVYLKLSADKTKIKKNETVTIVAQLFKHDEIVTYLKQVLFSINDTQKVISDFDTDKGVAVMTLKGSNQGKVKITAHTQYGSSIAHPTMVESNMLYIQDGVEE